MRDMETTRDAETARDAEAMRDTPVGAKRGVGIRGRRGDSPCKPKSWGSRDASERQPWGEAPRSYC